MTTIESLDELRKAKDKLILKIIIALKIDKLVDFISKKLKQ